MKIKLLVLVVLGLGAGSLATRAQSDTLRLSRGQCLEIALDQSPTIKVAELEVRRVSYARRELEGSLYPSVDFSMAYQRSIELQTLNMSMGGQSQKIKMGSDNMWNAGFTASMPIISPTLWKSICISKTQIEQALESSRASRLNLAHNINSAFYTLQLAIASRDVIKQNYDVAKFNADIYAKQFEQGTASEYDVLRSSVQVRNVEPELLQAEISVKQCQLQLKVLMGIDTDAVIMPDLTLPDMQEQMKGYLLSVDRSLTNNTSLRSLDLTAKLARQTVQMRKFAYIPTLGAQYSMNWNALSNGNALKNQEFNPYSTVALSLSVPIFSGGSRYNAVRQAKAQLAQVAFQREDLVHTLNMQVDLAIDNINKQMTQISTSHEGVAQAAKAYQIMQKSFEIGAATYLDLRDAELANTASQLSWLQAIYNYLVSTSELDLLLGKELSVNTNNATR